MAVTAGATMEIGDAAAANPTYRDEQIASLLTGKNLAFVS
jgi:hypothetical protein